MDFALSPSDHLDHELLQQLLNDEPPPDDEPDRPDNGEHVADHTDRAGRVAYRVERLRVEREARAVLDAELRGPLPPFDAGTLTEVLARPAQPEHRVQDLIPWEAGTLLTAQRKAGKTTTVLNLARSLLTGADFLGRFGVRRVDGEVALLNFEVSAAQLAHWAADVGVPPDRLYLVNLRGRRNPFADPDDEQRLADHLRARGVESIICDPFGRAYTGTSQNDPGEVTGWLVQLDQFARGMVGAHDLVLTAHAGWNGERTRGSSALEDWADSIMTLTRDAGEDTAGERYLRAIGRDVELDEDRLDFNADTRHLSLAGAGSRKGAATRRHLDELGATVLKIVADHPGINGAGVERTLRDSGQPFQKGQERRVLEDMVREGRLVREPGPRGAKLYTLPTHSPTLPNGDPLSPSPPPLLVGEGEGGLQDGADSSRSPAGRVCQICHQTMTIVEDGQTRHPTCTGAEAS